MKNFMNKPIRIDWREEDIYNEYAAEYTIKQISKRYDISIQEVRRLIKEFEKSKNKY